MLKEKEKNKLILKVIYLFYVFEAEMGRSSWCG